MTLNVSRSGFWASMNSWTKVFLRNKLVLRNTAIQSGTVDSWIKMISCKPAMMPRRLRSTNFALTVISATALSATLSAGLGQLSPSVNASESQNEPSTAQSPVALPTVVQTNTVDSTVALSVEKSLDREAEFKPLFDGKSFDGWEGSKEWFRIEDNAIVAGSLDRNIPHNYFLCTTESYSDFELKIEVKLKGTGDNAGVQFRTTRLENSTEVSGYQADVGRAWDRNVWGWLYDESRRNKVLAEGVDETIDKALKKGDWNELRVRAVGPKIELFLNGVPTVTYIEEDEKIQRSGIIGLQIHSGPPSEAWYRNIFIREMKAD